VQSTMKQPFSVRQLRALLPRFDPFCAWHPEGEWERYHALYGFDALASCQHYSAGVFQADDTELAVHFFAPSKAPSRSRGTVVLLHGYMDHVGLYTRLIDWVLQQGFCLVAYDLPGHGVSSGPEHAIQTFSDYALQLDALLDAYPELPGPRVLMGQSTGGAIALEHHRLCDQQTPKIASRILLAPLIRPSQYRSIQLRYLICHYFLERVKRFYTPNSHDERFVHFVREEDPLQKRWVSVDWIGAMLNWVTEIEAWRPKHSDAMVIQGDCDETVDWAHNLAVLKEVYPDIEVHIIESALHNLANEETAWREPVFDLIAKGLLRIHKKGTL
jgi:alpha-beta hydrolase superfamily lysophospholipase